MARRLKVIGVSCKKLFSYILKFLEVYKKSNLFGLFSSWDLDLLDGDYLALAWFHSKCVVVYGSLA